MQKVRQLLRALRRLGHRAQRGVKPRIDRLARRLIIGRLGHGAIRHGIDRRKSSAGGSTGSPLSGNAGATLLRSGGAAVRGAARPRAAGAAEVRMSIDTSVRSSDPGGATANAYSAISQL